MLELLADNPLLLLFAVAAIGYPLGRLKIAGFSLGVAAVLFAGLAVGALDPALALPEWVYLLGLVLVVYSIGLASGPSFVASLRRRGLRDILFVLVMLTLAAALTLLLARLLGFSASTAAGLYSGSFTNTAALAGVLDVLRRAGEEVSLSEPVVAYTLAYPMGIIGMILAIYLMQRLWRVDYASEARGLRDIGASGEHLVNVTVRVTRQEVTGKRLDDLIRGHTWHVLFGRHRRGDILHIISGDETLEYGDFISLVGEEQEVHEVAAQFGEVSTAHLEYDRSQLDFRRIFVSNPSVAGRRLGDLRLAQNLGAMVTRIRRGDTEMLPTSKSVLELGDRVRVVAPRERLEAVSKFFGDSYKALSEVDVLTLSLGIALGLLLGSIPLPLPGGNTFRLGSAGGPLLMGLVLGGLRRTGPLLWQLPYSASLTLRQFGMVLFLAGIGTRSGYAFASALGEGIGLALFLAGAFITCSTALLTLWLGYRVLKIPMSLLIGMVAGLSHPAVHAFADEQTGNDLAGVGYSTIFPVAIIAKILLAQLILLVL
jgi:putative transport protein